MKRQIAVGVSLLLTLGTAVAGTFIYGHGQSRPVIEASPTPDARRQVPTPHVIAMWKATAASADYVAPKVPI